MMEMTKHPNVFAKQTKKRALQVGHERVHFDQLGRERLFPAEGEQLSRQRRGASGGLANFRNVTRDRAFYACFTEGKVTLSEKATEQIIKATRKTVHDQPVRSQKMEAFELIMKLLA